MKTTQLSHVDIHERREWHLVDASEYKLGRMAAAIARILMGKHRPDYTPHVDGGDCVIVIHAERVQLTGNKAIEKTYSHYTGYPGGLRKIKIGAKPHTNPEAVIRLAVRRMLPKTVLGRRMLKKLKVYQGSEHPHQAQRPQPLAL